MSRPIARCGWMIRKAWNRFWREFWERRGLVQPMRNCAERIKRCDYMIGECR